MTKNNSSLSAKASARANSAKQNSPGKVWLSLNLIVLALFSLSLSNLVTLFALDNFKRQRENMVSEQIEKRGIKEKSVLQALRNVPRHLFVSEELQSLAYADRPLPIGYGQTISQPYIVALMTELLNLKQGNKVLEIGSGSGYQAAILSEITQEVYTIEIIEELGESAKKRLKDLGYQSIRCRIGDGYYGWEEYAPFDGIMVTAAATHIPPSLIRQLKKGGKMCIPVGDPFLTQNLILIEKDQEGNLKTKNILPVRFVPFVR
ncbi:MAG: protein-L-isoaspartate O-methyltransferase [bacterium (Candidatus Ratteibacteria) CG_4_9_14_3_um_filter_41_21]|uniref:Protein-L-isoaspartate O-methyltransferase n=3 Tax=Candidatus Ratteibacteria TaxID=2979319 RepID=A0A2M7YHR7_9BACT|nr:MAG: protein-L-isoaspartate O-methyltransferase [bacterium (Candidatus Ratteibacteria) CG15_BIG_FIL_POST_REV_8_21_14_020_41_12]PJA62510.1 MAG: protein-L-isoaspartate O-methyltransferase [bacterium (Candidatus Ratteibacteria) CG_4_9_14_3_um_filter_41_21]